MCARGFASGMDRVVCGFYRFYQQRATLFKEGRVPRSAGCAGAAAVAKELAMSDCLKGKSEAKKGAAKFQCRKCGARTDDKSHVCKPEKVKKKKK